MKTTFTLRELEKCAVKQGWRVERTNSSHIRFVPRDKRMRIVVTASTPSDPRGIRNLTSDLKRSGLDL